MSINLNPALLSLSHGTAIGGPDPSMRKKTNQTAKEGLLDCRSLRILIVDDDPTVLTLISRMVSLLGHNPDSSEDGMDALFQLSQRNYDVVLTDYGMPFLNGYQLAYQVKKRHPRAKIILMTGHGEKEAKRLMETSDVVDGLLLKPFRPAILKKEIDALESFHAGCLSR